MLEKSRILVVLDRVEDSDPHLTAGLDALGCRVEIARGDSMRLPERIEAFKPDVIIIRSESDARDMLEHVVFATRDQPRPIALFTDYSDTSQVPAMLRQGVSAYVVDGLNPARLKPVLEVAVARFQFEQQLRTELADAKTRLEDRKLIDRAKALLMKKTGVDEEEAFHKLRRMAMDKNLRIGEVAQRVIDMSDLLS